jgi:hypothetical protein
MTADTPITNASTKPRAGMVAVCVVMGLFMVYLLENMAAYRSFAEFAGPYPAAFARSHMISAAFTFAMTGTAILCLLFRPHITSIVFGIAAAWMMAIGRQALGAVLLAWLLGETFAFDSVPWTWAGIAIAAVISAYLVASAAMREYSGLAIIATLRAIWQRIIAINGAMGHRSVDQTSQLEDIFE